MNTIVLSDYSDDQKNTLRGWEASRLAKLMGKSKWSNPAEVSDWAQPNRVQREFLLEVYNGKTMALYAKPATVQEQVVLAGGDLEFKSVKLPATEATVPAFEATFPNKTPTLWVVDVVPVEELHLKTRPGLGRMCYFLASICKVKAGVISPILETRQYDMLEVQMFNPMGVADVCTFLEAVVLETKTQSIPVGQSGRDWINFLYRLLIDCSEANYIGIHSHVLSYCLFIGKMSPACEVQPDPKYVKLIKYHQALAHQAKREFISPRCYRLLSPKAYQALSTQYPNFKKMPIVGFLVGDVYADRRTVVGAESLHVAMNTVSAMISNRGGSSGPLGLLSGRYSVGMPSPTLEKLEEMLSVLSVYEHPANVLGLPDLAPSVWEQFRKSVDVELPEHRFVFTHHVAHKSASQIVDSKLPSVRFCYKDAKNRYAIPPRQSPDITEVDFFTQFTAWAEANVSGNDIWVGCMFLPWNFPQEHFALDKIAAHPMGLAYDARAIFSRQPVKVGLVDKVELTSRNGVEVKIKILKKETLKPYVGREWSSKIVQDIMHVPGYLVHPPFFTKLSRAQLIPPFKELPVFRTTDDTWELILGDDGRAEFALPKDENIRLDATGAIVPGTGPSMPSIELGATEEIAPVSLGQLFT